MKRYLRWFKGPEVCQHWNYRHYSEELLMFCQCQDCGHEWKVALCPNGKEMYE